MREILPTPQGARKSTRRSFPEPEAPLLRVFDPAAFTVLLDEDEFVGPDNERPELCARTRTNEEEAWARVVRKIAADSRQGWRRLLVGDAARAGRLRVVTSDAPHFAAVTGIIERAVLTSAATGDPVRFPPMLMLSGPGLGKTHYARAVAGALGTHAVPIALNATSDRGQLGGLSTVWRGARMGRFAKALTEGDTASPLFLLDEIDKTTDIAGENVDSILLSALEPENARAFTDEYLGLPVRLDHALWLASANDLSNISPPLLSRMLVVPVRDPTREEARVVVRSIAATTMSLPLAEDGVELLLDISPRKARLALQLAHPFAVCAGRAAIAAVDVRAALALVMADAGRRPIGFTAEAAR